MSSGLSWSRRLIDGYIMCGLTCIFLCVSTVFVQTWDVPVADLLPFAVGLAMAVLLLGAVMLRRSLIVQAAIEDQLLLVAHGAELESSLTLLPEPQPAAAAWNTIVERLNDQKAVESLDQRLRGAMTSVEHERWQDVFNALSDGIAICDSHQMVVQANSAFAALLCPAGLKTLETKSLLDLLDDLAAEHNPPETLNSLQNGTAVARDVQLGPEVASGVLRVSRTPLTSESFSSSSSLWTIRDITQQKLADEMRTQFVSTATHELRTPLTTILAYAEMLAQEEDLNVENQKSFCNVINSEASRLSRFVDQMLNVSQMEAGALTLAKHETDISRLVEEVLQNVQPQSVMKRQTFESLLPPKLPKLEADKDKLAAALVNLLGNAVKYTPEEGRVKLTVELANDQIHFHVDDTGIGISAKELPRISEKFFRSEDSRVQEINGSGLGLAFAQEVARLHGGRIIISSELNKGSRFTLALPVKKDGR